MDPAVSHDLSLLLRLLVAAGLTGLIGWEREAQGKAAGFRTHMLVGVSAALFMILGEVMLQRYPAADGSSRLDVSRVLEAVVAGVSFLGAGTIFVSRGQGVRGLTTAASLLAAAGVGVAVGLERYLLAVGTTLLLLLILEVLGWFEGARAGAGDADSR